MRLCRWLLLLSICGIWSAGSLLAQMPFYTHNSDVTDRGMLHFEFFDEYDGLSVGAIP